jgi:hypothetical protein
LVRGVWPRHVVCRHEYRYRDERRKGYGGQQQKEQSAGFRFLVHSRILSGVLLGRKANVGTMPMVRAINTLPSRILSRGGERQRAIHYMAMRDDDSCNDQAQSFNECQPTVRKRRIDSTNERLVVSGLN